VLLDQSKGVEHQNGATEGRLASTLGARQRGGGLELDDRRLVDPALLLERAGRHQRVVEPLPGFVAFIVRHRRGTLTFQTYPSVH